RPRQFQVHFHRGLHPQQPVARVLQAPLDVWHLKLRRAQPFSVAYVRVDWNAASGYLALSSTTLCIFSSRELLPLSPLVANTTISPPAFPVSGSKCSAPLFTANVPCTVCSVLSTVQCTLDWPGSTIKESSEDAAVAACSSCILGGAALADKSTASAASVAAPIPKDFQSFARMELLSPFVTRSETASL